MIFSSLIRADTSTTRRKRPVSGSQMHESSSSSISSGSGSGSGSVAPGAASTVHWKQLQARIQDVHTRWKGMRREAKRSVLATVSVHASASSSSSSSSSQSHDGFGAGSFSSSSSQLGRTAGTRGGQGGGAGGGRSTASSSFGDSARRDSFTARSTGRSFTPTKKTAFGGCDKEVNISYNAAAPVPSSGASLHKVLGVQLPLTFRDGDGDGDASEESNQEGHSNVSLDVPRVHQLQRDLVTFSRHAYTFSQLCELGDDSREGGNTTASSSLDGQKQALQGRLARVQALTQLRQSARALLLHSACLAPLLPLACACPALASNKTGLDALVELVR
jgi:hypothetical protein